MAAISLVNAMVFDGTGAEPFRATVNIEDDRIASIVPKGGRRRIVQARSFREPPTVIDCTGYTVMPGLTEAHCHISFNNIRSMNAVVAIQPEDHVLISLKNAQMLMERGFTSLYSAAAAKPRLDVAVRDAIDGGMFAGPRIRAASQEISPSGNLGDLNTNYLELPRSIAFTITCDGAAEFTKEARLAARDGVDNIKINVSGDRDWGHMHADDTTTVIAEEEVAAVVAVARPRKLMVNAHCTSSEGVKMCVRQGVQVIYHAVHADEEARDMLEAAKDWVFVAPALGLPITMFREARDYGLKWSAARYREPREGTGDGAGLHAGPEAARRARAARRRLWRLHHQPDRAPMRATSSTSSISSASRRWRRSSRRRRSGGELMQRGGELGQLRDGYLADLLVVRGDPLADIRILQDHERIEAVMVGGRFTKNRLPEGGRDVEMPDERRRA